MGRTVPKEVDDAGKVESAAEGRRGGPVRQARRHQEERIARRSMEKSMSETELKDMASTPRKGKPEKA